MGPHDVLTVCLWLFGNATLLTCLDCSLSRIRRAQACATMLSRRLA